MISGPPTLGFSRKPQSRVGKPRRSFKIIRFFITIALSVGIVGGLNMPSSTYDYSDGIHWDVSDLPVDWELNQNDTPYRDAVRAGYQTWEDVSGSYFTETYLGTTSRTGPLFDYHNVVSWGYVDPSDRLAACYIWVYAYDPTRYYEFDIVFEDSYLWSSTGEAGKYDVENIATHEFGHTLLLGDLYGGGDTEKTMYGWISAGETKKRSLHQDDIDGIRYIYPESGNNPPATPSSPTGPSSGTPGVSYSFSATTTDPDGDQVAFKFSWGDRTESGWTSFVNSGGSASASHSWASDGTYSVRAKARDIYYAESGWSGGHEIIISSPVLEVDPSSLDFREVGKGSSQTMTFRAYNVGGGTLSGTISDNRDWITVSPTSFEGNDNTISVIVATEGLVESLTPYTGTVTVTSNGGTRTVEVSVIVIPTGAVPYPNPFSLSRHTNLTFWGTSVQGGKIEIYNLAGELVKTLDEKYGASKVLWNGRNEKDEKVAKGIYICLIDNSKLKIAVLE